jgi:hypothetical protein
MRIVRTGGIYVWLRRRIMRKGCGLCYIRIMSCLVQRYVVILTNVEYHVDSWIADVLGALGSYFLPQNVGFE